MIAGARILGRPMLDVGGEMLKISVGGRVYEFEMHPIFGPALLDRNGNALDKQPIPFLKAVSLWAEQGRRMESGLCRWDHGSEPITKHMGGRHYKVIGWTEPRRGE